MQTNNGTYQPYPYQPLMQFFYTGGVPAQHADAVGMFIQWLAAKQPQAYAAVMRSRPDLLDPQRVVTGGQLNATPTTVKKANTTLKGLGLLDPATGREITYDEFGNILYTGGDPSTPITTWGQDLSNVVKAALAYKSQNDLLNVNLARAEKGLPPISAQSLAPQVNFGVSSGVQNLGMLAVGAFVLVGIMGVFKRR